MASSIKVHLKNKHSGRIWPTVEVAQPRPRDLTEDNLDIKRVITELEEAIDAEGDFREVPVLPREDIRGRRNSSVADEEDESEESFEEIDLGSSVSSRTIIDVKFSVCKTSTTNNFGLVHFSSATSATGGKPTHAADIDTTQSLQQLNHVTEVPSVYTAAHATSLVSDGEQTAIVTMEHLDPPLKKCSNWYCPHGKSPFQVGCLSITYLVLGVIFFPLLLIVFMVCCVSYFTPDID